MPKEWKYSYKKLFRILLFYASNFNLINPRDLKL